MGRWVDGQTDRPVSKWVDGWTEVKVIFLNIFLPHPQAESKALSGRARQMLATFSLKVEIRKNVFPEE